MDIPLTWLRTHKRAAIIAIAIVARLVILLAGSNVFYFEQTGRLHGSRAYDTYAQNLLETGVYGRDAGVPDSNIPPLYSYVLAAIYGLFGRGGLQVGLFHILLDAITIGLVYEVARRLFRQGEFWGQPPGEWVGAGAALFSALYPYLIFQNLTLNDTALYMLLMHAFVLLLVLLRDQKTTTRRTFGIAILAGLVLGITTLTRALLPLFALLAAIWFLFRLPLRETILRLLPVALVSLLVLIPWMLRSYRIYEAFVPVALNTGDNLYQGANPMTVPLFRAGYDVQWSQPPYQNWYTMRQRARALLGIQPPDESDEDSWYNNNQLLLEAALRYLRDNPERIPELLWVKLQVYWSIDIAPRHNPLPGQSLQLDDDGTLKVIADPESDLQDIDTIATYSSSLFDRIGRSVHRLYFGTLLLLAILGVALSWRQWREVSLLWFLQLSMTVMYLIFHPSTRYRVPTDPLLFAFSAYALLSMAYALRYRNSVL